MSTTPDVADGHETDVARALKDLVKKTAALLPPGHSYIIACMPKVESASEIPPSKIAYAGDSCMIRYMAMCVLNEHCKQLELEVNIARAETELAYAQGQSESASEGYGDEKEAAKRLAKATAELERLKALR